MSKSPGIQPARIYPLHDSDCAEDLYRDWAEKYDELCVQSINGLAYEKISYCKTREEMNDRGEIELVEDKSIACTVGTGIAGRLVIFRKGLAA
jgi:hypothetical protein